MKKQLALFLITLLFACNQRSDTSSSNNSEEDIHQNTATEEIKSTTVNVDYIDIKSLFELSPLSIFDETTEGLDLSEKDDLLKKGASDSWKISEESKTKLTIKSKRPSSEVTLRFLKNRANLDGLLLAYIINEKNTNLRSWKYSNADKTLNPVNVLKKYSANDFVSKEDALPDSYKPNLHYQFTDDETIEVSLNTWMDKAFEKREIINRIFLKWNGESFEEEMVKTHQASGTNNISLLDKSSYDLSKLEYDGKIVDKRVWKDSNGENIVLFTQKKEELFVYHYTVNSGAVKQLRKIYDFEKDCDFDMTLAFIENSIEVTDLDQNNFGEITFAYKKACRSDVSPLDLKLIMLEN